MPTEEPRGYNFIDPGLAQAHYGLSMDAQVQCLLYLMTIIVERNLVPKGVLLEVIPVQYIGAPYPAIGMYTERFLWPPHDLTRLSLTIGSQLEDFISEVGIDRLLELSPPASFCWQDILNH